MTSSLAVLIDDRFAGALVRMTGGTLRLDYEVSYRDDQMATPLSTAMPLGLARHPDAVVRPWLWGLLPDNLAVIDRWSRMFQASPSSPFALLASPVGEDCAGAVRFVSMDRVDDALAREGTVEWLSESDVEERLADLRRDATAWLGRAPSAQFSLAGAQAKTALLSRDGRWALPRGATPTTHILKPAIANFDGHDLNEHLCLAAADRVGLVVARTSVQRFGAESAIVVERYDRRLVDGRYLRLHQEDLCQALGLPPGQKYQADGGPSPRAIADLLREAMPTDVAATAIASFADGLIWNWIIAGTDAHAKNYSLLLSGRQVRFAPLYDIASALPYRDFHEKKLRFAMKIGRDYRVYTYRNPWPAAADELGLDPDALVARAADLAGRAPAAFAAATTDPDVVAMNSEMPGRLVELVSERAARCVTTLG